MERCELLVMTEDGYQVIGTFTLSGDKVYTQPKHGNELVFSNAMKRSHVVGDDLVSVSKDPVAWFNSLPSHYNGSHMRARMV